MVFKRKLQLVADTQKGFHLPEEEDRLSQTDQRELYIQTLNTLIINTKFERLKEKDIN